ncbi:hypothetical protein D9M70_579280 [compost metagenome]
MHGGRPWPKPLGAPPHDVFEHHDGIVDDEPGRKHDRQQRQDVDGKAGEIDRRHRADQRDRHADRRDQRRPPVEQEHVDDQRYDEDGDDQRDLDLMDGAVDEDGIVAGDPELRALGQDLRLDRIDDLAHALGNIDGV